MGSAPGMYSAGAIGLVGLSHTDPRVRVVGAFTPLSDTSLSSESASCWMLRCIIDFIYNKTQIRRHTDVESLNPNPAYGFFVYVSV